VRKAAPSRRSASSQISGVKRLSLMSRVLSWWGYGRAPDQIAFALYQA
jgi:hypothetical protein